MSVFKRLWSTQEKDTKGEIMILFCSFGQSGCYLKELKLAYIMIKREPTVEEISECQPFNPFTEILFLEQHKDIVRILLKIDSKRCVSAADDNLAIIWDIQLGYRLVTLSGHSRPITAMLHMPAKGDHHQQLLTGSSDKQIRLWNVDTGDCLKVLTEHGTSVKCLMTYRNPDIFCSAGEELCLWTRSGQLMTSLQHRDDTNDTINFMITIRNDRIVTAVDKYLTVYVVNETSDEQGHQLTITFVKKMPPHREAIKSLINVADDRFASGSIDGTIIVWKTDTLYSLKFFNNVQDHEYKGNDNTFPYSVEQMICIDQHCIVAAIGSGFAIYDTDTGQTLLQKLRAHHSKVTCLTFTCSGLYLVTAAVDGSIRLWSYCEILKDAIQNEDRSKTAFTTYNEKGIYHMCWTKQKHQYDLSLVGECLGHSGPIQVLLDCDGESLASCGVDSLVIVWKNENVQMMKRSHILQTLMIPDGIV